MEPLKRVSLGYSLKNIPIPSQEIYLKSLIEKVTSVIQRMRWRAFHFLKGADGSESATNYYGLKSRKCPPHVEELKAFEDDLQKLVESVSFRKTHDKFQETLKKDVARIKSSNSVFVPADKTRNLYEMDRERYEKLLTENITKHYRTADDDAYDDINEEACVIAGRLNVNLAERMDTMAKNEAYITLKDHKDNFLHSLPCRLINPAKSEMGRVSKRILDSINEKLKEKIDVTMWKNSAAVIRWFKEIKDKNNCTFMSFDIVEFYPSITEELLEKALAWARRQTEIPKDEIDVIQHARKSLLFNGRKAWMKKGESGLFDVTMGSHDGAEVCELVGIFALAQLPKRYRGKNVGLYRDDGLGVLRGMTGSAADRARKDVVDHFKKLGLRLTIDTNIKTTNFLDLTLDLHSGKHYPYRKPNDNPLYIDRRSNHPPAILKELPAAISRRLTHISHDEEVFNSAAPLYNDALRRSGYTEEIAYAPDQKTNQPQRPRATIRRRNITWFNPPYSRNVTTNIGRRFLSLIDKHFPKGNKLNKIFNRGTLKVSYSCTENMSKIIKGHNSRVRHAANPATSNTTRRCNCRKPLECPLNGECLASCIVYQATVKTSGEASAMHYIGSTETSFKLRYSNHKASLTHASKANQTELSKYVWQLKREGKPHSITWKILRRAASYTTSTKRCQLCLTEKMLIATAEKPTLLNKRSELASKCRHQNKFYLSNFVRAPS